MKYRLLIAEHKTEQRERWTRVFSASPSFESVIAVKDSFEAFSSYQIQRPDIVLVQSALPTTNGLLLSWNLVTRDPTAMIIVTKDKPRLELIELAISFGARGFLEESTVITDLEPAIHCLLGGQLFFSDDIATLVADAYAEKALSKAPLTTDPLSIC